METLETPKDEEQPQSQLSHLEKEYEYNSRKYKILINIELSQILIQIEEMNSNSKKIFRNSFTREKLIGINKYFKMADSIQEELDIFKKLLLDVKDYKIENKNDNEVQLIFPLTLNCIIIPLLKYNVEKELDYSRLSDETKKLIDNNDLILGIDLGTTYSCAAVMIDRKIIVIENSLGQRTIPSYVSFFGPYERCVGELAKLRPSEERKTVYNSKRLLGKKYDDLENEIIIEDLPFTLIEDKIFKKVKIEMKFINDDDNKKKEIKEYYPEQISAMILKKILKDSEYYLSKKIGKDIKIKRAVITVPAYFNQNQREATEQAAQIINLKIERMINEPTAASLAYGYKTLGNYQKLIVVIDFGGGTLDITLLKFMKNDNGIYYDVKCSFGNTSLGGEDFDYELMKKCIKSDIFEKKLPCNIRLKRACEAAKIKLSTSKSTNIILEEYMPNKNIVEFITRKKFEDYCSDIFKKFKKIIEKFLKDYKIKEKDISEVILIGGSTLIPKIQEIIRKIFKNSEIKKDLNPNEAVAKGASILGGILSKLSYLNNINLLDVTNLTLGINVKGNLMSTIIKRSTPIPKLADDIFKTVEDNQTEASIEIYEGEEKNNINNLCLGKFIIKNLPKRKAGMTKIKVEFNITSDSILKVKAYDLQNDNNVEELTIEKPKGLMDIMNFLTKVEEKIKDNEVKEYSKIKDSILDMEEKLIKTTDLKEIISLNEKIIHQIGEFILLVIERISKEKIITSYIKYYFQKVNKHLEINNNFKEDKTFNKTLDRILEEIQYYSPEFICEIIECFVDYKEIYDKCLLQLIKNYYGKLGIGFYSINILIKEKKESSYKDALEKLIDSGLCFCDKANKDDIEVQYLKNYILDFKIKIDVKKMIIKNLQQNLKYKEIVDLNNLIENYKKCKTLVVEDLMELESINKKSIENNDREMKKAENFLAQFKNMKDNDPVKFDYIFEKYNPDENKYNYTVIYEFTYTTTQKEQEDILTEMCATFLKLEQEITQSKKKDAYTAAICQYLNDLKVINSQKTLFHK